MPTIALKDFLKDESGAMAIEYGLIAALVSVASIVALLTLGGSLNSIFGVISSKLGNIASRANNP